MNSGYPSFCTIFLLCIISHLYYCCFVYIAIVVAGSYNLDVGNKFKVSSTSTSTSLHAAVLVFAFERSDLVGNFKVSLL